MNLRDNMLALSFDVTRRCNMNCDFCFRGESQNQDITHDIIDKTLDECQNVYIHMLQLFGGEPTLNLEIIEYIFDGVIKRNIAIGSVNMFTNGLICNEKILKNFEKIIKYIESREKEIEKYYNFFIQTCEYNYVKDSTKKATVIISDNKNDVDYIDKAFMFYNKVKSDKFAVVKQHEAFSGKRYIIISGNAEKNAKQYLTNKISLENIRLPNNKHFFISDSPIGRCVNDVIYVATNGNIYSTCSSSYKEIDEFSMFNIFDCRNNLCDKIEEWCWKHPISRVANIILERYRAAVYCKENGIYTKENLDEYIAEYKTFEMFIELIKNNSIELHKKYPQITFNELFKLACGKTCNYDIPKLGVPTTFFKSYLNVIIDVNDGELDTLCSSIDFRFYAANIIGKYK